MRSDFVVVEPVRYESSAPPAVTNAPFGWVRTTADRAERFRVRVGPSTYERIIGLDRARDTHPALAQQISALSAFAEAEVVRQKVCMAASTPEDARRVFVTNNPLEFWTYVQCVGA